MDIYQEALNKVTKWRSVFAGWQLGTRVTDDPEAQAVRDHREVTILLRVECTSFLRILIEKKIITEEEVTRIMAEEAEHLSAMYEKKFPGMKADLMGVVMTLPEAAETMKGWRP